MHRIKNNGGCYDFEETCPNCDKLIPIEIDDFEHECYEIDCPSCGYRMMLCTLCYWDQEDEEDFDGHHKCDWRKKDGCYRKLKKKGGSNNSV